MANAEDAASAIFDIGSHRPAKTGSPPKRGRGNGIMLSFKGWIGCLAAGATMLMPGAGNAQDKNQIRDALTQFRARGEPKDHCNLGMELQGQDVVVATSPTSSLAVGDRLLSLGGIDLAGKSDEDTIAILRGTAPDATISATVNRGGQTVPLQIACTNSRPGMEAEMLGLEQMLAGKFNDCLATASRPGDWRLSMAGMKAQCASQAKHANPRAVAEANYEFLRLSIGYATFVPERRAQIAQAVHAMETLLTRNMGADRYQELVGLMQAWPGDEHLFARSEPDWALFRRNGEQALREHLIDPASAQIEWPHGFVYGAWKPLLSKRVSGYWTCGTINARNRLGGYVGATAFVVVMDPSGTVLFSDMGSGQSFDLVSAQCAKGAAMPPPPPAALTDVPQAGSGTTASLGDELNKLAGLKASGALSEAEFQAAKARLLGSNP